MRFTACCLRTPFHVSTHTETLAGQSAWTSAHSLLPPQTSFSFPLPKHCLTLQKVPHGETNQSSTLALCKLKSRAFIWSFTLPSTCSFCKLQKSHWCTRSDYKVGPEGRYCMCQNRHVIVCTITNDLLHRASKSCKVLAAVTVSSSTSKLLLCFQKHGKCFL